MAYHLGDVKDGEDFIQKIKKPAKLRNRTLRTIKKYLPKEEHFQLSEKFSYCRL